MKTLITLILAISPLLIVAQDIIDAKTANDLAKKGEVMFVSAQSASDFAKVHAYGAVNIDPASLVDENQMLKPTYEVADILGKKGIAANQRIVIYDDGSMKGAGRVYWTLKYLGASEVSVVDGGMKMWRINRLPVTKNPTMVKKATFSPKIQKRFYADFALVNQAIKNSNYVIVDARTAEEYLDPDGHIPGSVNVDYAEVITNKGTLKPVADLNTLFKSYGVTKDKKVIVYCKSSVRAGIVFLALHSALDFPEVMVYDGAFIEWQQKAPNNIETQ